MGVEVTKELYDKVDASLLGSTITVALYKKGHAYAVPVECTATIIKIVKEMRARGNSVTYNVTIDINDISNRPENTTFWDVDPRYIKQYNYKYMQDATMDHNDDVEQNVMVMKERAIKLKKTLWQYKDTLSSHMSPPNNRIDGDEEYWIKLEDDIDNRHRTGVGRQAGIGEPMASLIPMSSTPMSSGS